MVSFGAAAFMAAWIVVKAAPGQAELSSTIRVAALAPMLKKTDKKSSVAIVINLILKIPKPDPLAGTGCVKDAIDLKENTDLVIISRITKKAEQGRGSLPAPFLA
jgi:hypothetical protein